MKDYPSIPRSIGQSFQEFDAYVFDKIDGSNLRFMWTKKQGWCRFGTRTRLFDETDPMFSSAKAVFFNELGPQIEDVARKNRWDQIIAFCEYLGPNSFAGRHIDDEPKDLILFDVNVHKRGIIGPKEFLDQFKYVEKKAAFLGKFKWTRGFVERVFNNDVPGITEEGVVGKAGEGHQLIMAKAKTKIWLDKVRAMYAADEAERIINS